MLRTVTLELLLFVSTAVCTFADETEPGTAIACAHDDSTLRLYFSPTVTNAQNGQPISKFVPEVARLFVDDTYVGDAIVNLHGHLPTLKFAAGQHTIRVQMSKDRVFESKINFLGRGSMQYLFVSFDAKATVAKR